MNLSKPISKLQYPAFNGVPECVLGNFKCTLRYIFELLMLKASMNFLYIYIIYFLTVSIPPLSPPISPQHLSPLYSLLRVNERMQCNLRNVCKFAQAAPKILFTKFSCQILTFARRTTHNQQANPGWKIREAECCMEFGEIRQLFSSAAAACRPNIFPLTD